MARSHTSSVTSIAAYEQLPTQGSSSRGSFRWFAVLCIIALLTASLHENIYMVPVNRSNSYNFLLFSQETSSGYCAGAHCFSSHVRRFWTVHGLWPSNETTWPQFCNTSQKFDIALLDPIRADLEKFWPSAIQKKNDYFWSHEWEKHGTCASDIPELAGVFNYFNSTLSLLRTYNVTNFLLDANIMPSRTQTFTVNEILRALSDDLSTKANIACHTATGYAYPVLSEVRFCLSKTTLTPIDCKIKHENCGNGKIFYLPKDDHEQPQLGLWMHLMYDLFRYYVLYMSPV